MFVIRHTAVPLKEQSPVVCYLKVEQWLAGWKQNIDEADKYATVTDAAQHLATHVAKDQISRVSIVQVQKTEQPTWETTEAVMAGSGFWAIEYTGETPASYRRKKWNKGPVMLQAKFDEDSGWGNIDTCARFRDPSNLIQHLMAYLKQTRHSNQIISNYRVVEINPVRPLSEWEEVRAV